jgi:hypothetical protein
MLAAAVGAVQCVAFGSGRRGGLSSQCTVGGGTMPSKVLLGFPLLGYPLSRRPGSGGRTQSSPLHAGWDREELRHPLAARSHLRPIPIRPRSSCVSTYGLVVLREGCQ